MESTSNGSVEIVFPPDSRQQIKQTLVYPYSAIGRLTIKFPNGKWYSGSGTLIDNRHVVTAAHNLWGDDLGGNAVEIYFSPAQNGGTEPFGRLSASHMWITEEYRTTAPPSPLTNDVTDYTKYIWDFGLIRLSKEVPEESGYCHMYALSDKILKESAVHITGYPGDLAKVYGVGTMWSAYGSVTLSDDDDLLFYKIATNKGESGAGLMIPYLNTYVISGIHVAGSAKLDSNFAVRLNQAHIDTITSWRNS